MSDHFHSYSREEYQQERQLSPPHRPDDPQTERPGDSLRTGKDPLFVLRMIARRR